MAALLRCGFCSQMVYPFDLYSHAMSSHQNHVTHLIEESKKAWTNSQGACVCNVKVAGQACGKNAVVLGGVRVHTLVRASMLHNPTPGSNIILDSGQMICADHAQQMTASDLLDMIVGREQLEEVAGQQGFAIDWMWKNEYGDMGPELLWFPVMQVALN